MFFKNRCPVCMKFFCCSEHKNDHMLKIHKVEQMKDRQDLLVKMFQKKAEMILMKSQQYNEKVTIFEKNEGRNHAKNRRAVKRTHNIMTRQILTASVSVLSQARPIIIPVRRMKRNNLSNNNKGEYRSMNDETKVISPYDNTVVKTSTPINPIAPAFSHLHQPDKEGKVMSNSLSRYQTPPNLDQLSVFKTPMGSARTLLTPLRGIITKTSKYESNSNPSPTPSLLRSRKVTFSFSSQVSSTQSSPLESVPEDEMLSKDQFNYVVEQISINNSVANKESENKENTVLVDDSPSSVKEGGFFSCVTNMFCSAVHTLPSLANWRLTQNSQSITKFSRSVKRTIEDELMLNSPVPKRRCYPWDLRQNPIRARKPISKV